MTLHIPDSALFDMDGLLIDSERLSLQSFSETTAAYGLGEHRDVFLSVIGTNEAFLMATLDQAFGDQLDVPAFRKDWAERYHVLISDGNVLLKPGVLELLDWLGAQGVKMAVATSSATPIAALKLTRTGIIKRFQEIVGGDMVLRSKPDPEIFLKAASALDADHSRTLVLEDSSNGVKAGVAAGFTVIQVPDLVEPTAELLQLEHRVCTSLHHVLDELKSGRVNFASGARTLSD